MAALDRGAGVAGGRPVIRRLFVVLVVVAIATLLAAPAFAQTPISDPSSITSEMIVLALASAAVTALTGLVKKIAGPGLDGTAAQRYVALGMTAVIFFGVKLLHLAPDLQQSLWGVLAWLFVTYVSATGIYTHTSDLKGDPAQLSGNH